MINGCCVGFGSPETRVGQPTNGLSVRESRVSSSNKGRYEGEGLVLAIVGYLEDGEEPITNPIGSSN